MRSLCPETDFGLVFKILLIARRPRYFKFWSESSIRIRSFCTQSWILAAWLGIPVDIEISTAITVLMHSYSRDIAEVEWIRLVSGSISFFPNRGSSGVSAPNNLMILISIQLLVELVISLKKVGARER